MAKKEAVEKEKKQALEMRERALERLGETRKRTEEQKEEEKKTSTATKRRRRLGGDTLEWLKQEFKRREEKREEREMQQNILKEREKISIQCVMKRVGKNVAYAEGCLSFGDLEQSSPVHTKASSICCTVTTLKPAFSTIKICVPDSSHETAYLEMAAEDLFTGLPDLLSYFHHNELTNKFRYPFLKDLKLYFEQVYKDAFLLVEPRIDIYARFKTLASAQHSVVEKGVEDLFLY
ncbi:hypothetical protein ACROYT_G014856 [Oculina patagonica]